MGMFKVIAQGLTLALTALFLLQTAVAQAAGEGGFVGAGVCAQCHEEQAELWRGSHHDWAMKPATPDHVLGDFDNVTFDHYGDKSRFFRRDDGFYVETANADGAPEIFRIAYTFGVTPLQQYLIAFPDGRMQALSVSWDSRPASEGGQRWFHLYPGERIPPGDVLHWTGTYFNWNSRCAACHSTNLEKNYDAGKDRYDTRWSEINVACEACHGPGRKHVAWAESGAANDDVETRGLERTLSALGQWRRNEGESTAHLIEKAAPGLDGQLSACGSCHSRRMVIADPDLPGHFLDKHQIELLNPPLYHRDGQIRDEVYVMGSFLQSKMYKKGVVCSNCHEPHSLELKAEGNALCAQCHAPSVYDSKKHHHHPAGSGAQCVNCHMPEQTYMVVDPRRDHSLRVPRPDLSARLGAPNACTQCHREKPDAWAARALGDWLAESGKSPPRHYGETFAAAFENSADAEQQLRQLAAQADVPGIVRGTALSLLADRPNETSLQAARDNLKDADPLVRIGALRALDMLPPDRRTPDAFPLLEDPVRAVRLEATRLLNAVQDPTLSDPQKTMLAKAREDYLLMLTGHADTPGGQLNLGRFHVGRGQYDLAEQAYQKALAFDPHNLPATLNLADLYRLRHQEAKGETLLRAAIEKAPQAAALHHALGLALIRQKRYDAAEPFLARAAELAPDNLRYGYVYAVALTSRGKPAQGLEILGVLHERHPDSPEVLYALVEGHRRAGDWRRALIHAEKLQKLQPDDPQIETLIHSLRQQRPAPQK